MQSGFSSSKSSMKAYLDIGIGSKEAYETEFKHYIVSQDFYEQVGPQVRSQEKGRKFTACQASADFSVARVLNAWDWSQFKST